MKRQGGSFVEILIAFVVALLVLALASRAAVLGSGYVRMGELAHAVTGAAEAGAELEADLRQAVRDPASGAATRVTTGAAGASGAALSAVAFYRAVPGDAGVRVVPVRWSLESAGPRAARLVRTAWDPDANRWTRHALPAVTCGTPHDADASSQPQLCVTDDAAHSLVTVEAIVLARDRETPGLVGSGADRVSARVTVSIPACTRLAARFLQPVKTLDDLPDK